uniref:Uncharacterized protein n=1 Tax=Romanomermis culicivorax TaxID=13658 RepID=A0A915J128_ROMCU
MINMSPANSLINSRGSKDRRVADEETDYNRFKSLKSKAPEKVGASWWNLYPYGDQEFDLTVLDIPNHDTQIDLDFYFPFYGFRFNYTFILPNGIITFSRPDWIQPPYTFPNPKWPDKPDAAFIAPFFAAASFQYVGDVGISNVWYRTVHRPRGDPGDFDIEGRQPSGRDKFPNFNQFAVPPRRQNGYVEDNDLLDVITLDVQEAVSGANGFRAFHALLLTWERMAYGGAPKIIDLEQYDLAKQWVT